MTNIESGARTTCVVGDYGPAQWTGRIIDLDATVFDNIAELGAGVIRVRIEW